MAEQKQKYITAIGRRKESTVRVYLREGTGKIRINKRSFENYFPRESHRLVINQPLKTAELKNKLDIFATINGGGISGQAQALRHGISRAIVKLDETKRSCIKKGNFLTRDSRAKERKKYGRKRARKRFQYSKR
ncbi:MAG: 30S ribosomal protein S9 [Candidatus Omnitrophota bacterium]|nr:MAG: 30S ribosomal protein S9 [Candidatus Omnitrophota bacterium]